ncbi:MAG: hypothetical protein ACLQK8_12650 [Streptosporangiaceae bacterium]
MPKSTQAHLCEHTGLSKPWGSWGSTMRYLITESAQAIPTVMLIWMYYIHH